MRIRNWLQCPSSITHGNIIKREIFSKKTLAISPKRELS